MPASQPETNLKQPKLLNAKVVNLKRYIKTTIT